MGGTSPSIFTDKSLMQELQSFLCSSPGESSDFCNADSSKWPSFSNNQTRLAYPEKNELGSVAGTDEFCDAYLDWLDDARLGRTSLAPSTSTLAKHSRNLDELANFCVNVQEEAINNPSSHTTESKRTDDAISPIQPSSPKKPAGKEALIVVLVGDLVLFVISWFALSASETLQKDPIYLVKKFGNLKNLIGLFKKPRELDISDEAIMAQLQKWRKHEFHAPSAVSIDSLPYQVRHYVVHLARQTWNKLSRVTQNVHLILQEDGKHEMDHPHGLPGSFIQDFAKTHLIKQNVKRLEKKARKWLFEILSVRPPNFDTIILQTRSDIRERHRANLPASRIITIAQNALGEWSSLKTKEQIALLDLDTLLSKLGLPQTFIRQIVDKYYSPPTPSAENTLRQITANINLQDLRNQLVSTLEVVSIRNYLINNDNIFADHPKMLEYLAKTAKKEWLNLSFPENKYFIDYANLPDTGHLPDAFIKHFIKNIAPVRLQDLDIQTQFLWEFMPSDLKPIFSHKGKFAPYPTPFFATLIISLDSDVKSDSLFNRANAPWNYESLDHRILYKGHNLSAMMQELVNRNEVLAFYPLLLKQLAKIITDESKAASGSSGNGSIGNTNIKGLIPQGGSGISSTSLMPVNMPHNNSAFMIGANHFLGINTIHRPIISLIARWPVKTSHLAWSRVYI